MCACVHINFFYIFIRAKQQLYIRLMKIESERDMRIINNKYGNLPIININESIFGFKKENKLRWILYKLLHVMQRMCLHIADDSKTNYDSLS